MLLTASIFTKSPCSSCLVSGSHASLMLRHVSTDLRFKRIHHTLSSYPHASPSMPFCLSLSTSLLPYLTYPHSLHQIPSYLSPARQTTLLLHLPCRLLLHPFPSSTHYWYFILFFFHVVNIFCVVCVCVCLNFKWALMCFMCHSHIRRYWYVWVCVWSMVTERFLPPAFLVMAKGNIVRSQYYVPRLDNVDYNVFIIPLLYLNDYLLPVQSINWWYPN